MEEDVSNLNRKRQSVIEWIGKTLALQDNVCNLAAITAKQRSLRLHSDDIHKDRRSDSAQDSLHRIRRKDARKDRPSESREVRCCEFDGKSVSNYTPANRGNYRCTYCSKSFQWCSHWLAHERIHTGERPFKCEICNKAFTRSDGLKCHETTHKHEKRKTLFHLKQKTTHSTMDKHGVTERGHNDEVKDAKRLKCEKCNRVFNRPSALDIHSRVHTGVKPYPCNICTKSFSIYGNLRRHLLIHTGERPYTCSKCSISFNNSSHLKRHIKNKHSGKTSSKSNLKH